MHRGVELVYVDHVASAIIEGAVIFHPQVPMLETMKLVSILNVKAKSYRDKRNEKLNIHAGMLVLILRMEVQARVLIGRRFAVSF